MKTILYSIFLSLFPYIASAQSYYYPYGMSQMMYGGYHPFAFGIIGGIFGLLFWILVIIAIIYLIRFIIKGGSQGQHPYHHHHIEMKEDKSMEILKERYAKGEITKEQFDKMKEDLKK